MIRATDVLDVDALCDGCIGYCIGDTSAVIGCLEDIFAHFNPCGCRIECVVPAILPVHICYLPSLMLRNV